ncbi:MAG: diguanylate cyclase [Opitutae bacterium]|nr:diguanylate cyclase [Opitutae bacterium]
MTAQTQRRRVLVIDDDPIQFRLVQELFTKFRGERFTLEWASQYENGLRHLLSGEYCTCLLDYQLGNRDGLELLREAQAAQCRTPVIVLTGWSTEEVDFAAMDAGASDYLVKDEITPRLLERAIRYILKLHETMEALRQLATHDELTGLFNRRELIRTLRDEAQRAQRFRRPFALTLIDLDHFKQINDTHGHQAGDHVLRQVADRLAAHIRAVDRVARYGGEEFALVQVEADRVTALDAAQRLCAQFAANPCILPERGLVLPVTLSAGVAAFPADGDTIDVLVEAADRALYTAKARGRNIAIGAHEATANILTAEPPIASVASVADSAAQTPPVAHA